MDVMFLQSGEFVPKPTTLYQKIGRWYRRIVSPRCSRKSAAVITISDFSKRDIIQFIPGLDPSRLAVTHLACDLSFTDLGEAKLIDSIKTLGSMPNGPFLLCLGADDPRKNTLRMVQAFLKLLRENGVAESLVVAGYKNWETSLAYKEVQKAGAMDKVKFLAFVPMSELVSLYRQATLFAYPSLYEGFGIPILEAFSTGCPVVASGTTSIPEVGGEAALYINPESVADLAAAMLRLINDQSLREKMIGLGRARAAQFNWDRVAKQTIDVYLQCLDCN
jgi:glycosyltransferase involved in cell wall biosynthesis